MQEVKRNILKMFHIVPYIIYNLFWKNHENQFTHFFVLLLTDTDSP